MDVLSVGAESFDQVGDLAWIHASSEQMFVPRQNSFVLKHKRNRNQGLQFAFQRQTQQSI